MNPLNGIDDEARHDAIDLGDDHTRLLVPLGFNTQPPTEIDDRDDLASQIDGTRECRVGIRIFENLRNGQDFLDLGHIDPVVTGNLFHLVFGMMDHELDNLKFIGSRLEQDLALIAQRSLLPRSARGDMPPVKRSYPPTGN